MADWVLTKGLQNLRSQVNAAFPGRDKASDGTIGDLAHMAETSGHNPDDTAGSHPEYNDHDGIAEVRSWDMDSDLRAPGVTAQAVVDHIRGLPGVSSVLRYMIYNRKIYEASNSWKPRAYAGPSAHTEHIHYSGARTQAADNNTTFDYHLEDLVMPTADEFVDALLARRLPYPYGPAGDTRTVGDLLRYNVSLDGVANKVNEKLAPQFVALSGALAELAGKPVDLSPQDVGEIVSGLLAGLPAELAKQIATKTLDEAAARLSGEVQQDPAG